jgi:alanine racemase
MMHFSDADGERLGQSGIEVQLKIFEDTVQDLPGERSICNSAAILRHGSQLTSKTVRAGILLYGSSPDFPQHSIQDWNLQPSMSLRSEIIAIQDLQPMQTVGYGSTFQVEQAMKIGIVAVVMPMVISVFLLQVRLCWSMASALARLVGSVWICWRSM